jgi:ABC-type sulfate transport system permease component
MWITAIEALTNSQPASAGEFSLLWSLIVPGLILLCSVILTWLLYRHFKKSS